MFSINTIFKGIGGSFINLLLILLFMKKYGINTKFRLMKIYGIYKNAVP